MEEIFQNIPRHLAETEREETEVETETQVEASGSEVQENSEGEE